jgi:hypothetical protein
MPLQSTSTNKGAFHALTRRAYRPQARGTGCRRCIRSAFAPVTLHDGALGGKVDPGHSADFSILHDPVAVA